MPLFQASRPSRTRPAARPAFEGPGAEFSVPRGGTGRKSKGTEFRTPCLQTLVGHAEFDPFAIRPHRKAKGLSCLQTSVGRAEFGPFATASRWYWTLGPNPCRQGVASDGPSSQWWPLTCLPSLPPCMGSCKWIEIKKNVKKLNTLTMDKFHQIFYLTQWGFNIMRSILSSHVMVTENLQKVHKTCFWTISMIFIFHLKIYLIILEHQCVRLIFL